MLASGQNPHPIPINEFRQADGALRLPSRQLHLRRVNECRQDRHGLHHLAGGGGGGGRWAAATEVAADGGVEGEGGEQGREEDDEDHGEVLIEISPVSVRKPLVCGGKVT